MKLSLIIVAIACAIMWWMNLRARDQEAIFSERAFWLEGNAIAFLFVAIVCTILFFT